MCGIFAAVSKGGHVQLDEELKANLSRRGPDHWGSALSSSSGAYQLSFFSSVLALRGGHVTAQPLVDAGTGSILCWNGEAWKIAGSRISGNDGEAVLSLLSAATMIAAPEDSRRGILDTLRSVQGPFAFVFFDKRHEIVYFARDCLGRRSLLFSIDEMGESIQFSSLAPPSSSHWHEVEADGIYSMRLGDLSDTLARGDVALGSDRIERVSWSVLDSHNAEVGFHLLRSCFSTYLLGVSACVYEFVVAHGMPFATCRLTICVSSGRAPEDFARASSHEHPRP